MRSDYAFCALAESPVGPLPSITLCAVSFRCGADVLIRSSCWTVNTVRRRITVRVNPAGWAQRTMRSTRVDKREINAKSCEFPSATRRALGPGVRVFVRISGRAHSAITLQ